MGWAVTTDPPSDPVPTGQAVTVPDGWPPQCPPVAAYRWRRYAAWMILAPMLRPGDTVALVSPSSAPDPDRVAHGVAMLTSWGLSVQHGTDLYARYGYLAGPDSVRRAALQAALDDPRVRAVICTRGGYGAQRIVDDLDLTAMRTDPKVVVGFSDITALQLALWRVARLASVHGPGAAWSDRRTPAASADSLRDALMTTRPVLLHRDPQAETGSLALPGSPRRQQPARRDDPAAPDSTATRDSTASRNSPAPPHGHAAGPLLGGNLCLLATTAGTPDLPDLTGAILLLEDVDEAPYRIDRMLTQLHRAGARSAVAGVARGPFTDSTATTGPGVAEVLHERLAPLGVPVLGGLPIGHGPGQLTVPVGTPARLDVTAGTLTVAPAVRAPGDS